MNANNASYFISFDSFCIDLDQVNVVWNRKWRYERSINFPDDGINQISRGNLLKASSVEIRGLSNFIFHTLKDAHWLDYHTVSTIPKLQQLDLAKKCGLFIPQTIITNNKQILQKFKDKFISIITKPIGDGTFLMLDENKYVAYTSILLQKDIDELPDTFFPSLFQEQIEKDFEIRVFYLEKELYSMAIFSQADNQTSVDFRRFNNVRPNRNIPILLPEAIALKIKTFMRKANLNSGSIDLIRTKTGEYVFLEVNPVGQYSMVDLPCNYGLNKLIANYLIKHDNYGKSKRNPTFSENSGE